MADKELETDRWISHFRSMAKGIGDNEQQKFYVCQEMHIHCIFSSYDSKRC